MVQEGDIPKYPKFDDLKLLEFPDLMFWRWREGGGSHTNLTPPAYGARTVDHM